MMRRRMTFQLAEKFKGSVEKEGNAPRAQEDLSVCRQGPLRLPPQEPRRGEEREREYAATEKTFRKCRYVRTIGIGPDDEQRRPEHDQPENGESLPAAFRRRQEQDRAQDRPARGGGPVVLKRKRDRQRQREDRGAEERGLKFRSVRAPFPQPDRFQQRHRRDQNGISGRRQPFDIVGKVILIDHADPQRDPPYRGGHRQQPFGQAQRGIFFPDDRNDREYQEVHEDRSQTHQVDPIGKVSRPDRQDQRAQDECRDLQAPPPVQPRDDQDPRRDDHRVNAEERQVPAAVRKQDRGQVAARASGERDRKQAQFRGNGHRRGRGQYHEAEAEQLRQDRIDLAPGIRAHVERDDPRGEDADGKDMEFLPDPAHPADQHPESGEEGQADPQFGPDQVLFDGVFQEEAETAQQNDDPRADEPGRGRRIFHGNVLLAVPADAEPGPECIERRRLFRLFRSGRFGRGRRRRDLSCGRTAPQRSLNGGFGFRRRLCRGRGPDRCGCRTLYRLSGGHPRRFVFPRLLFPLKQGFDPAQFPDDVKDADQHYQHHDQ